MKLNYRRQLYFENRLRSIYSIFTIIIYFEAVVSQEDLVKDGQMLVVGCMYANGLIMCADGINISSRIRTDKVQLLNCII